MPLIVQSPSMKASCFSTSAGWVLVAAGAASASNIANACIVISPFDLAYLQSSPAVCDPLPMPPQDTVRRDLWKDALCLVLVTLVSALPYIGRIGFYSDD